MDRIPAILPPIGPADEDGTGPRQAGVPPRHLQRGRHDLRPRDRRIALELYDSLQVIGLGHAMHKYPTELSGEMKQRVGIARAFALNPKMLLLDEPFGMLDALTRFELQDVLIDLWSQNQKTALMVTHDVDETLFLSDRVVIMTNCPATTIGEIVDIPFTRPRKREDVLEHSQYYELRKRLVGFLEAQHHRKAPVSHLSSDRTPVTSEAAAQQDTAGMLSGT
jgi:nitrate/nitrite transport system ATP-binding protein